MLKVGVSKFISVVSSLIILFIGGIVFCYCRKKIITAIASEIKSISISISAFPQPPPPLTEFQVLDKDTLTMDKFFQELAQQKPVRFTAQQLYTCTENYTTILGFGGFGKVYRGQFPNGVKIEVKVLSANKNIEEQFMAEVGTIGRTHHINLVRLHGFCYDEFMNALVYEFMENGSLDKYLFSEIQKLEWEKLHEIAVGTAKGIAYLHEECQKMIIHYNRKPGNVLLDMDSSPKVADFGLANLCNREDTHVSVMGYRGTPGYSSPEFMLKNFPITYKCDVYNFGI